MAAPLKHEMSAINQRHWLHGVPCGSITANEIAGKHAAIEIGQASKASAEAATQPMKKRNSTKKLLKIKWFKTYGGGMAARSKRNISKIKKKIKLENRNDEIK